MTAISSAEGDAGDYVRFVRKTPDGEATFEAAVRGAHCANCLAKIERGMREIPGVTAARLNLSTGKLSVSWQGTSVTPERVMQRVRALGYEIQPYEAGAALEAGSQEGVFLLRCLAVAGVGAVFVVGLTDAVWYASWYGGSDDMSAAVRNTFFWLAGAVSIPATLYGSIPFFRSAWRSLSHAQTNMDVPISLAIVLSLALSVYQTLVHSAETYFDAAVMLVFLLLIGRYLDFLLRDRARSAAHHLLAMQSAPARRLDAGGHVQAVAVKDLAPGDRIFLASGERAPVDGTLEDYGTDADISLVTGESAPVALAAGDVLRAGSVIVGRPVVLKAIAAVEDSLVADLARLLEAGQQARSLYVRLADRAARAYVPFVTSLSALVFIGWLLAGASIATAVTNAITILIITCPCALGLAVPAVQIVATGRLFNRGLFVKSGDALERLSEIDTAVFDKTGTLTLGMPMLENAQSIPRTTLETAASLARASRHPLARALAEAAGAGPVAAGVQETPGAGLEARIDGRTLRLGNAAWCGMPAAAQGSVLWFRDGETAPVRFDFEDRIRPESRAMLDALRARGIAVEMLTGDREEPAARLAIEANIARWHAHVGPKEKAARLEELRRTGHRALMVGDGLNDAGALALAHVSIAPGSAADVSQLAADMVLRGESMTPIVEALDVSRKARRLVLQNFAFAALYNLTAIPLAVFGIVSPLIAAFTMAGSSLIVTLNALRLMAGTAR